MADAKDKKGITSKDKELPPIEYVPKNLARKFMSKEEAIADKQKLTDRRNAGKKAMKEFDKEDAKKESDKKKADAQAKKEKEVAEASKAKTKQ